jgi:SAM-dependent methyltransferase
MNGFVLSDSPATRFSAFCADRLVSYVRPRPGSKVLDVATGSGEVAVAFAQAVAPGGRVTAIDAQPERLERAAANVRKMGLDNVDLHDMDVVGLAFRSGYFHTVVCSYTVQLLADPLAALNAWTRMLRPGGRAAFTSFAASAFRPMLDDLLVRLPAFGVEAPSWPCAALATLQDCRGLLDAVGLSEVDAQMLQLGYHLRDEQEWWEVVTGTALGLLLDALPGAAQTALREQHLSAVAEFKTDQGLWMDVQTCFASGSKSPS